MPANTTEQRDDRATPGTSLAAAGLVAITEPVNNAGSVTRGLMKPILLRPRSLADRERSAFAAWLLDLLEAADRRELQSLAVLRAGKRGRRLRAK